MSKRNILYIAWYVIVPQFSLTNRGTYFFVMKVKINFGAVNPTVFSLPWFSGLGLAPKIEKLGTLVTSRVDGSSRSPCSLPHLT